MEPGGGRSRSAEVFLFHPLYCVSVWNFITGKQQLQHQTNRLSLHAQKEMEEVLQVILEHVSLHCPNLLIVRGQKSDFSLTLLCERGLFLCDA